ncbi:serine/threonine-protein kinase [Streptomyces sp. NPDC002004]
MQGLLLAGRYRLGESIGRGGMGRVWRAHDEVLHRAVAVKELTAALYVPEGDRAVLLARTQTEARAAARISHPAVVTVHDVLEHDDRPWIVMELVEGCSLADAVKDEGRIDPVRAARTGLWVLRALRAAHAAGVLHRDVKPGNVLLAKDGRVLLTDFGIAQVEGDTTITRTGEIVGSVDYLAPERVRGADPGPSADLWALGATLYTAVEGRSPFRRTSPLTTMQAVVEEEPPEPVSAGPLAPVITALLRKDPQTRPSAEEAEHMLAEAAEGRRPSAAQAYVPTQRVPEEDVTRVRQAPAPPPRRRRGVRTALVVALAAALVGVGGAVALKYLDRRDASGSADRTAPTGQHTSVPGTSPSQRSGAIPDDWRRVNDVAGFSLSLPKTWKRQTDGSQIDYTPDNLKHFVRISVDRHPDYDDPFRHQIDLEKQLTRLKDYHRIGLTSNTYRDCHGSLWEFTWNALPKNGPPGARHAIEQTYLGRDGVEYAIYMSVPAAEWPGTREQFDAVLRSWTP